MSDRVLLKGLLVDSIFPTELRFQIKLDVSTVADQVYMPFKEKLEDILKEIDESHAKRATRGRTVKANYVTEGDGKGTHRVRVLFFSPVPSVLLNRMKKLRANWYEVLEDLTITIERTEQRVLRLLPSENAKALQEKRDEFNVQIAKVDSEAQAFIKTTQYQAIMDHLAEYGFKDIVAPTSSRNGLPGGLPAIRVRLFPLNFDKQVYEELLDKAVVKELVDTEKQIKERIGFQFEGRVKDAIEQLSILLKAKSPDVNYLKLRVSNLRGLMKGSMAFATPDYLKDVSESFFEALDNMPQKGKISSQEREQKLEHAVKSLAVAVKIPLREVESLDTRSTVTKILTTMSTTLSERAKVMMEML